MLMLQVHQYNRTWMTTFSACLLSLGAIFLCESTLITIDLFFCQLHTDSIEAINYSSSSFVVSLLTATGIGANTGYYNYEELKTNRIQNFFLIILRNYGNPTLFITNRFQNCGSCKC